MKKRLLALCLIAALLLTGCSLPQPPQTAADGTPWSDDWTTIGAVLGVENVDGWRLLRNEDALAAEGMYFASWVMGEPSLNAEGESSYPAQVFLVLSECEDPRAAEGLVAEWATLAEQSYDTAEASPLDHPLGAFTLTPYDFPADSDTFRHGMSCLGVVGSRAVNLELSFRDEISLDPEQTLTAFLNGFHFAD